MSETSQTSSENEKGPQGSRKRTLHNEIERRRKDKINGWISKIGELLPGKDLYKQSKISILEQTVDYIKQLASEKEKLLSQNRSEVQALEVNQLKKELKITREQNALYEKLLQQANISLGSLPKKSLKYTDKFERRNGVLTVKNSDSNINSPNNPPVSLNDNNVTNNESIPPTVTSKSTVASKKEKPPKTKKCKAPAKSSSTKPKTPVSICPSPVSNAPTVETSNQTSSCVVVTPTTSVATINMVPQISQGSVLPSLEVAKDSTFHTGGVTTVLSQFPLMSTAHGSSLVNMCNKNLSTIIIPSAGGLLQPFPTEKQSNTISIICPSTLPIILPQQLFNVSSVVRNMNLPFLCPAETAVQPEKSTLGNTLLTINPNTVVPISSNISASTQFLLQPPVLGTLAADPKQNVVPSLVNPVTNDQIVVPLLQSVPVSAPLEKCVQPSTSMPTTKQSSQNKGQGDVPQKSSKGTAPIQSVVVSEPPKSCANDSAAVSVEKSQSGTCVLSPQTDKTISPNKVIRSFSSNPLPSLQVLSANKIISLAKNQCPKVHVNVLSNENKFAHDSNNLSSVTETIPSEDLNVNHNQSNSLNTPVSSNAVAATPQSMSAKNLELTSKSNFSLNVLMGDIITENKTDNDPKEIRNASESRTPTTLTPTPVTIGNLSTVSNSNFRASSISFVTISGKDTTGLVTSQVNSTTPLNKDVNVGMSQAEQQAPTYTTGLVTSQVNRATPLNKDVNIGMSQTEQQAPTYTTGLVTSQVNSTTPLNKDVNVGMSQTEQQAPTYTTGLVTSQVNSTTPLNKNVNVGMSQAEQQAPTYLPENPSSSYSCVSQLISSSKSVPSVMSCDSTVNDSLKSNTLSVNIFSKSYSSPKETNGLQSNSDIKQSNAVNLLVPVNSSNTFNENVPYITNDSCQNQSLLPSLFSSNQFVNTSVFVCPVQEVASNGRLLNQGSNTVPTTSINSYMIPNVCSNPSTYSMMNKDNMLGTFSSTAASENSKVSNESVVSISSSAHEATNINSNISKSITPNAQKNDKVVSTPCSKQMSNAKKKKTPPKGKPISSDVHSVCNPNTSAVSSDFELSKSQSTESPTFSKSDDGLCMRPESNNFIFTSDILARATESIFGSDMLDGTHLSKRSMIFYTDENSHLSVSVPLPEKQQGDSNYKLLCLPSQEDRTGMESSPGVISESPKNSGAGNLFPNLSENREGNVLNSHEISPKQNKACKIRKSKSLLELEPPMKRLKDNSEVSNKPSNSHGFATLNSGGDIDKGHVSSNILFTEKQASAESQLAEGDHSVIDSGGHFGTQIHIPENSCKTPTSVDSILSITPSFGDILKDVSHGIGIEANRNNTYLSCNENPSIFSGEKHFLSLNYSNNAAEEYLNLPRMHFPVVSEIPTPVLQTTNASFSHSISLCSTQSETTKASDSLSSTDPLAKPDSKKKPAVCNTQDSNALSHSLVSNNAIPKQADCVPKISSSAPAFSIASKIQNTSSSLLFDGQPEIHNQNLNVSHSTNSIISQAEPHFSSRDNFPASHAVSFYPSLSNSSNIQNFVATSSMLPHSNFHSSSSSNLTNLPFSIQSTSVSTNPTYNSHSTLPFSHSLCSLLKESNNGISENRTGSNGPSSSSSSAPSNISQSKYSTLSLISNHTSYSELPTSSCHSEYVHNSVVCTPTVSEVQYTSTNSCGRAQRSSLSYSTESLLQTSCVSSDKNKSKNPVGNRFPQRLNEKKSDRNNISNININDTNIFMPVTSCDISIQNAPLVPLPSVTSFHNFPSTYTLCETVPSTTIFNSVSRTHDVPLSLSNENFLNHMSLNVDSQMLGNRHDVSSTVPKPHTNITIPFENHRSIYNNCSLLTHVKPPLESSQSSEPSACFPPASFSNSYSQSLQKTNCCHFTHQPPTDHPANISLSVGPPPFHTDKTNFQSNCSPLQTPFTQSNTNYVGNLLYNTSTPNSRNEMAAKPSSTTNNRATQESAYVPEGGPRQNLHDHPTIFPPLPRKTTSSNRSKSKKLKNSNEGIPNSFPSESPKSSCISNSYYKPNSHAAIPSENAANSAIPGNPTFNLHQQGDNFFNLNFQPSNFTMSPLPRPPTQPLSCSCLTTPIISHTYSSSNHPVPTFNLSNILPDMGCSGNQVPSLPSVKFPPPVNHPLQSSSAQCQTSNSAQIISHQSSLNPLYPAHPPMVRGPLNPILPHNPQSFGDGQVPLVGSGAPPVMPQNTTFSATQNPPFRNVIHPLGFPRGDR